MNSKRMPAELMNELFGSLPMKNAFGFLAKMSNGLLARNVQKMINDIKMAMKKNKLNVLDCGPKLSITDEEGLVAKHSGPNGYNSVRTILPIPTFILNAINKSIILFYFEMEILIKSQRNSVGIGYCGQQFPLESKYLGQENNSIGIWHKNGMLIDGSWTKIGNDNEYFKKGDFVGIGLILQPWNVLPLGMANWKTELPSKYTKIQLFPAVDLFCIGDSVRAYFVKEKWQFKEFGSVLE